MTELLQHPATDVFFYALITAVATGLGALPFFLIKDLTRSWLGISNAVASGLMLAASFGLIYEGLDYDLWFTIFGIVIGLGFIVISQRILDKYDDQFSIKNISRVDSSKILLIIGIMTLHSFTEGISVGVSFSGGLDLGLFITTAIAVNNIPVSNQLGANTARGIPLESSVVEHLLQPAPAVNGGSGLSVCRNFSRIFADGIGFCRRRYDLDGLCRTHPRCVGRKQNIHRSNHHHYLCCLDDRFSSAHKLT